MALDPITAGIEAVSRIIDRVLPDKAANDAAKLELLRMQTSGDFTLLGKQLDVNAEEAKSASLFVAGWRPFIGWVCGFALAYQYVLRPLSVSIAAAFDVGLPLVTLDDNLWELMFGMLGMGALRSWDKRKGVAQ